MAVRKVIHIDMDAFFASIEQRDSPKYRGKPLIVGGAPDRRGVVATASYEARKYGIHSAMSSSAARRLCPQAIFVAPRMEVYAAVSAQIMAILHRYTDLVEPASLDEAYLDVTANRPGLPYASEVARAIKRDIYSATRLTASAGVGPNKFIAKIASDMNKPDGLTVIMPEQVSALLHDLPVRRIPGIGRATEAKMAALCIRTVGDLAGLSLRELVALFGKAGHWYYSIARGEDDRPVVPEQLRKSISVETTFERDLGALREVREALRELALELQQRLAEEDLRGRTVILKITYADFVKITRRRTLGTYHRDAATLYQTVQVLLAATEAGVRPIRLLGIGVANLDNAASRSERGMSDAGQLALPFA